MSKPNFEQLYNELLVKYKDLQIQLQSTKLNKGALCSIQGNNYEKQIHEILKNTLINNKKFHTNFELGGSTNKNDLICNYINDMDICIEIKKSNTPDWMQCSLKLDKITNKWKGTPNGKIPKECREKFNELLNNITLFNNNIPPFINKNITYNEWINIKNTTQLWNLTPANVARQMVSNLHNW